MSELALMQDQGNTCAHRAPSAAMDSSSSTNLAATSIPVFDLTETSPSLARTVTAAATTHGFLFIKSTPSLPFSPSTIRAAFSLSRNFFSSPLSEKSTAPMQPNNRGWTSMGGETLDPATQKTGDPKEAFNFGEFIDGKAQQPLPPAFVGHEPELSAFSAGCYALCGQILKLIAMGLEIEDGVEAGADWFTTRHDPKKGDSGTILRLLHYPGSHAASRIRAGAHSDYGSLTLLFRLPGQPGLEILTPKGDWEVVPVQPAGTEDDEVPPILVNIGDLLSYWTGGLLRSTVHRVVGYSEGEEGTPEGPAGDRYSIAFFCHPCRDIELVPVPSNIVRKHVSEHSTTSSGNRSSVVDATGDKGQKVLTANEHLQGRLAATYGWSKAVTAN